MNFRDPLTANRGARTEYRCPHCRTFNVKAHPYAPCPQCDQHPHMPNEGLRAAKMNSGLWAQANRASRS